LRIRWSVVDFVLGLRAGVHDFVDTWRAGRRIDVRCEFCTQIVLRQVRMQRDWPSKIDDHRHLGRHVRELRDVISEHWSRELDDSMSFAYHDRGSLSREGILLSALPRYRYWNLYKPYRLSDWFRFSNCACYWRKVGANGTQSKFDRPLYEGWRTVQLSVIIEAIAGAQDERARETWV
jgi:hypothetical protein